MDGAQRRGTDLSPSIKCPPRHTEADIFTCGREAARHSERPQVASGVDLDADEKVVGVRGTVCLEPTLRETLAIKVSVEINR